MGAEPADRRSYQWWDTVVLSPHFDDAALSCGGTIHRWSTAGARVLVVTVCAGVPASALLSPFAEALHRRWRSDPGGPEATPETMTEVRRAEDERALREIGAEGVWLDVPDAIYRGNAGSGHWPYCDDATLFGEVDPSDRATADRIVDALASLPGVGEATEVVAPLAVGGHVDHRLVRRAAEAWRGPARRWHYEDYPYASDAAALVAVVSRDPAWGARLVRLDEEDVVAKVAAVGTYTSQISTFWRDLTTMAAALRAFGLKTGGGTAAERFWRCGNASWHDRDGERAFPIGSALSRFYQGGGPPEFLC